MPQDTTIFYNELALFQSGPCQTDPGELTARDAITQAPGGTGSTVVGQGTKARTIIQRGTLIADTKAGLQEQVVQIESHVGNGVATLIDEHEKAWDYCLLHAFETAGIKQLGPRHVMDYTIHYLQTRP